MALCISSKFRQQLLHWAAHAGDEECCGLIYGIENNATRLELVENIAHNKRTHFEIEPARLIAAEKADREGQELLLGYFHSHPGGRLVPSDTDTAMAALDGRYWVIIDSDDVTAWIMAATRKFQQQEVMVITCRA